MKVTMLEPHGLPTGLDSAKGASVSDGVRARYTLKDYQNPAEGVTDDGVIEWICSVPAGTAIDLNLSWEINTPVGVSWAFQ